jgi:hypothetical protein
VSKVILFFTRRKILRVKKRYFTNQLHKKNFWRPLLNAQVFSFICVYKKLFLTQMREKMNRYGTFFNASEPIQKSHIL